MEQHQHGSFHNTPQNVRRVIWVGIIVDSTLSALKIVIGALGQSSALMADGLHSLSDLISSLVVMIGFHVSFKPADSKHPYGHGRAESIAGWVVSLILLIIGCGIAVKAVVEFSSGNVSQPKPYTLGIVLLSIAAKEGMFRYKMHLGKKLQSLSLIADAWHHRSDALSSLVALVGIGGAVLGGARWRFMDHLAAFAVAIIIIQVAVKIFRQTSSELMDAMPSGEIISRFKNLAMEVESVQGVEKIVARKSGIDLLVDMHVEVDKDMTVEKSHLIAQKVRDKIIEHTPNVRKVLVHIEPYYPNDH